MKVLDQIPCSQSGTSLRLWTTSTLTPWGTEHSVSVTWSQVKAIFVDQSSNYNGLSLTAFCLPSSRQVLEEELWSHLLLHWKWGEHLGVCPELWIHRGVSCSAESADDIWWTCKKHTSRNELLNLMELVLLLINAYGRAEFGWDGTYGNAWKVLTLCVLDHLHSSYLKFYKVN